MNRIKSHPILEISEREPVTFYWKDRLIHSYKGETISSALIANGIKIFSHHQKDNLPQGIFCSNGQCSQCLVIMDGKPVKGCMTFVQSGIHVEPAENLPTLPPVEEIGDLGNYLDTPIIEIPVLIIGGGPAGLSASLELSKFGIRSLIIDDKNRLGGKLVLQTHRFFGSSQAVFAGKRGIEIASILENEVTHSANIDVWLQSIALAIFEDKTVGVLKNNDQYVFVKPRVLLVATGARERSLAFKGNTLPGVYGAGAFQTLVNRDLVLPSKKLFIIGGGNVGLIAGYHAIQANISVIGLSEVMSTCSGYRVHFDKLVRLGVPIFTNHTVLAAHGKDSVEGITIVEVDNNFKSLPNTEKQFECDTILVAVGLNPVNEFILKAEEVKLPVYAAGDAHEIAEASAAMFSGKIVGRKIVRIFNNNSVEIPESWKEFENILKSKPGSVNKPDYQKKDLAVYPVIHCRQEIPCDPCSTVCPKNLIKIDPKDIRSLPLFCVEENKICIGCERCVAVCPGLAITLVDYRKNPSLPTVSIPYELQREKIREGDHVLVTDIDGDELHTLKVEKIRTIKDFPGTLIVRVQCPVDIAEKIAGIRLEEARKSEGIKLYETDNLNDDDFICRCEHVTVGQIRELIKNGVRDMNQIKAVTKASMGACGGKTCLKMIENIFKAEGLSLNEITPITIRPLFVEIPIQILSGKVEEKN